MQMHDIMFFFYLIFCLTFVKNFLNFFCKLVHLFPHLFQVCSNGHILLLPNTRSKVRKYASPRYLRSLRGHPIISAFWARANIKCGKGHAITYGQSRKKSLRRQIKGLVNDAHFSPQAVIWATYRNLRPLKGRQVRKERATIREGNDHVPFRFGAEGCYFMSYFLSNPNTFCKDMYLHKDYDRELAFLSQNVISFQHYW